MHCEECPTCENSLSLSLSLCDMQRFGNYRRQSITNLRKYLVRNCDLLKHSTTIIGFQGLGSPVFDKLEAELAKAALSLPATKGFEFGSGFSG